MSEYPEINYSLPDEVLVPATQVGDASHYLGRAILGETTQPAIENEITRPPVEQRAATEQIKDFPTPEELLEDIIVYDAELPDGLEPTAVIVGQRRLCIGGIEVQLTDLETCLFNICMANRGVSLRSGHFQRLGFPPTAKKSTFLRTLASLQNKLSDAVRRPVITTSGRGQTTNYTLDSGFLVTTSIQENDASSTASGPTPTRLRAPAIPASQGRTTVWEGAEELGEGKRRELDVFAAVKLYRDHPAVIRKLTAARKPNSQPASESFDAVGYINWLGDQYELVDELAAQQALGRMIGNGLEVYRTLGKDEIAPDPKQKKALIDMAYAFDHLHLANLRLVISLAKTEGRSLPFEDAVQFGNYGLMQAVARYEPGRGYMFSSHATEWIRYAIREGVANTARTIRIPEYLHEQYVAVIKAQRTLARQLGRNPTIEEIAAQCGLSPQKIEERMRVGEMGLPSLDQKIGEDATLGDFVANTPDTTNESDKTLAEKEMIKLIQYGLGSRALFIIGLRFGISPDDLGNITVERQGQPDITYREAARHLQKTEVRVGATQEAIGKLLGISRERITQIEKKSLEDLAAFLNKHADEWR